MKTKCLLYCTKAKPILQRDKTNGYCRLWQEKNNRLNCDYLNGKIVCECEVECEEIYEQPSWARKHPYEAKLTAYEDLLKKSCLTEQKLCEYIHNIYKIDTLRGYALHISNLKIFDEPLELGELEHKRIINIGTMKVPVTIDNYLSVRKAPQNMMWVWYKGEKYCLISIRPEWLCKILNGEKTIEVRKKILKGMM